jgi:hypothetical protein
MRIWRTLKEKGAVEMEVRMFRGEILEVVKCQLAAKVFSTGE